MLPTPFQYRPLGAITRAAAKHPSPGPALSWRALNILAGVLLACLFASCIAAPPSTKTPTGAAEEVAKHHQRIAGALETDVTALRAAAGVVREQAAASQPDPGELASAASQVDTSAADVHQQASDLTGGATAKATQAAISAEKKIAGERDQYAKAWQAEKDRADSELRHKIILGIIVAGLACAGGVAAGLYTGIRPLTVLGGAAGVAAVALVALLRLVDWVAAHSVIVDIGLGVIVVGGAVWLAVYLIRTHGGIGQMADLVDVLKPSLTPLAKQVVFEAGRVEDIVSAPIRKIVDEHRAKKADAAPPPPPVAPLAPLAPITPPPAQP